VELGALGHHLLVELYGCSPEALDQVEVARDAMIAVAGLVNATVLGVSEHRFQPQGVSVVVVIAESHVSIHTWPEHGYAAADVFTCSGSIAAEKVVQLLRERFLARQADAIEVQRGILSIVDAERRVTHGEPLAAPTGSRR
jgi:S-adenosylmethionine decarboxylase proenzyme